MERRHPVGGARASLPALSAQRERSSVPPAVAGGLSTLKGVNKVAWGKRAARQPRITCE
jgi:hypothetical protein